MPLGVGVPGEDGYSQQHSRPLYEAGVRHLLGDLM